MARRAPILLAALALVTAGCAGASSGPSTKPPPRSGFIVGHVEDTRTGSPSTRPVRNAPLVVTGRTAAGFRLVRYYTADPDGNFRLRLPPGTYVVAARVDRYTLVRHEPVVLRIGQVARVAFADRAALVDAAGRHTD
jgi:Carboxypeptidase regulatory-like domain